VGFGAGGLGLCIYLASIFDIQGTPSILIPMSAFFVFARVGRSVDEFFENSQRKIKVSADKNELDEYKSMIRELERRRDRDLEWRRDRDLEYLEKKLIKELKEQSSDSTDIFLKMEEITSRLSEMIKVPTFRDRELEWLIIKNDINQIIGILKKFRN
jgi:hypothetical protein